MPGEPRFNDRAHAGRLLAERLGHLGGRDDVTVLALPRGGVPVAYQVAVALHAPLDVLIVRKLGVPGQPELAMGAISGGGVRVLNRSVIDGLLIAPEAVEEVVRRETAELLRRERAYRQGLPPAEIAGRVVVVIDDGVATGATMLAAVAALRSAASPPERTVVAVPVGPTDTRTALAVEADEVVCLHTPVSFRAVGQWYEDFLPPTDDDIRAFLSVGRSAGQERG